jgi:hypothetical protein
MTLDIVTAYLLVALGIVVSVIIPILREGLPKPGAEGSALEGFLEIARPYVVLGLFSLATGLILVAFAGDTVRQSWQTAVLAGYAWDSTLQKIKG